jgi:hypothetical protein
MRISIGTGQKVGSLYNLEFDSYHSVLKIMFLLRVVCTFRAKQSLTHFKLIETRNTYPEKI